MSAVVPFPLPPDRVLFAWRSQLAAYRPRRLRLAHLLLHRVECLVRIARRCAVDPFRAALLRQLSAAAPLERLRVDRAVLARWLQELSAEGLCEGADGRLTEKGRQALDSGAYAAAAEERRVFTFLDEDGPTNSHPFLPLHGPAVALAPPPGWRFDAAALEACVRQPEEWKTRHGFPTDVEAVLGPSGPGAAAEEWRRVILDRPEQILLVFVLSGEAPPLRLGFAVRPEGWALQAETAALTLSAEALPELDAEPSAEDWREAWRGWGRLHGLSAADADAFRVQPLEDRVQAAAPRKVVERLGGDRNEAWLLAGAGGVRVAAPLEIVEGE